MRETTASLEWIEHADLTALCTLRMPARARWLVRVRTREALHALREDYRYRGAKTWILGGGSNVLLAPELDGVVIQPTFAGWQCESASDDSALIRAEAGLGWHQLVLGTVAQGWHGLENLALIPGHCGAAPIQNIGAYGSELAEHLERVESMDMRTGEVRWHPRQELALSYRDSIFKRLPQLLITRIELRLKREAVLRTDYSGIREELATMGLNPAAVRAMDVMHAVMQLRQRKLPDPAMEPNAGSYFQNPVVSMRCAEQLASQHPAIPRWPQHDQRCKLSAAWLIEHAGLKGFRLGPCRVSERHSLVLINEGGSSAQVLALEAYINDSVQQRFGIRLTREPVLLG